MPVEVYRSTGERSLLNNLAKPLTKYSSVPAPRMKVATISELSRCRNYDGSKVPGPPSVIGSRGTSLERSHRAQTLVKAPLR